MLVIKINLVFDQLIYNLLYFIQSKRFSNFLENPLIKDINFS